MGSKEIELLAIIAAGTKRKKRAVNILKVAKALKDLYNLYDSSDAVSKAVKLSPEMIREFLELRELTGEVKTLIRKGLINSVDIGYRISKLPSKDQVILAKNTLKKKLSSNDVRAIVKHKIDNPKISINKVVKDVLESKVKKIFVAYLGIDKNTFERLEKEYKTKNKTNLIKALFYKVINKQNIVFFSLNGRVVVIKVLREGLEEMGSKAKNLKISLNKLANALVKEYLEGKK